MSIDKKNKLNQLLSRWPDGHIKSSQWLKEQGYGSNLIQKYKKGQWIEPLGKGAYKKFNDSVGWRAGIACAQQQLSLPVHIGGKSAISILGKSQYLLLNQKSIEVIGNKKALLPSWLKNYNWEVTLRYQIKNLFRNDVFGEKQFGYTTKEMGNISLIVSSAERAYLEYLDELPKRYSYTEAFEILENLTSLRSKVLQNLLENCTSIKVKRLFLHLADKVQHPWFKKIDLNKIDLGKGKRLIFKNGILDSKYQITIPKDAFYDES